MRAVVTGTLELTDLKPWEEQKIKDYLSIDDPAYYQKIRINPKAKFFLSPQFHHYVQKRNQTGRLVAPRGIAGWLRRSFEASWEVKTVKAPYEYTWQEEIVLRENQKGLVEDVIRQPQGLIVLPTGFGKSIIALKLIKELGQRALIIVPKKPIQEAFLSDIQRYFGFDARAAESPIHVRTPAFIASRIKRNDFDGSAYGCVIYDECHGVAADGARKLFDSLPAHYRYGLTGTLDRSDGQGPAIAFYFGEVLVERHQTLARPKVVINHYRGGGAVDVYHKMTEAMATDENRNQAIAELVETLPGKTLVLTKRVVHYGLIAEKIKGKKVIVLNSDDNAKEAKERLRALRDGSEPFDVILGTFSLLGTGTDIPSLDTLVLAGDLKSSVLHKQAAGRILRLFEGKKEPVIHDIVDIDNPILFRQAKARQKVYNELNWPTSVCPMKTQGVISLFPKDLLHLFDTPRT